MQVDAPNRAFLSMAVAWLVAWVIVSFSACARLACEHMLRVPRHAIAGAGLEPVHLERRKAGIVHRLVVTKPAS